MGAVQLAGKRGQQRLGLDRGAGVVGTAHPFLRMIEVRVLDPPEVVRNGKPVATLGDRERAVLALLAIHAGEVVSADHLADRLP
jgi:hypothetical protein